jgi:hypothetical protein
MEAKVVPSFKSQQWAFFAAFDGRLKEQHGLSVPSRLCGWARRVNNRARVPEVIRPISGAAAASEATNRVEGLLASD